MNILPKQLIVLTSNMASLPRSQIPRIWMRIIGHGNKRKGVENVLVYHLRCIKNVLTKEAPITIPTNMTVIL